MVRLIGSCTRDAIEMRLRSTHKFSLCRVSGLIRKTLLIGSLRNDLVDLIIRHRSSEGIMFRNRRHEKRGPTEREQRVIELVAQGLKNREVANAMGTTEHVVKNYLRAVYDKLGLWNRVELALWYEARRHQIPSHT